MNDRAHLKTSNDIGRGAVTRSGNRGHSAAALNSVKVGIQRERGKSAHITANRRRGINGQGADNDYINLNEGNLSAGPGGRNQMFKNKSNSRVNNSNSN